MSETADAPTKRRVAPWLLFALLGLSPLMYLRGPGVANLDAGWLGARVDAEGAVVEVQGEPGLYLWVPIYHAFLRVDARARATELSFVVRSKRGVPVTLSGGEIAHRVDASGLRTLLQRVGPEVGARDATVQRMARGAALEVFGSLDAGSLTRPVLVRRAMNGLEALLRKRLSAEGVTLLRFNAPSWKLPGAVEGPLAALAAVARAQDGHDDQAAFIAGQGGDRAHTTLGEREAAYTALAAELEAKVNAARAAVAEARLQADLDYIQRETEAEASRDEAIARAEADEASVAVEIEALRLRVSAFADGSTAVLDRVIAEHIIPQLRRVGGK